MNTKGITLICLCYFCPILMAGIKFGKFNSLYLSKNNFEVTESITNVKSGIQCAIFALRKGFLAFYFDKNMSQCNLGQVTNEEKGTKHPINEGDIPIHIQGNVLNLKFSKIITK